MENNDGNIKSQQTGGLKLMTVFIAVLALHVVVIGGFTVYHLMSGGTTDADLTLDKTHKDLKVDTTTVADNATTPDASKPATPDATTPTTTPAPVTAASTPDAAPQPDVTPAPIPSTAPKPAPATSVTTTMPKPATVLTPTPIKPAASTVTTIAPSAPAFSSLAPRQEPLSLAAPAPLTPLLTTPVASAPLSSGPVHMPPATTAPAPPHVAIAAPDKTPAHVTETSAKKETYTVKITDSYKKIAKAHHITVAQLKDANNIKGDTLHTGQKLVIPSAKTSLAKADAEPSATPAVASVTTGSHHKFYTIEKGDTLAKIAKKFNTTKTALLSANDIANPAKLTVGKKLKIPATKEARSTVTTAPAPATAQPARIQMQPLTAPVAQPAPAPQPMATQPPSPQPQITPELANMTF